MVIRRLMYAASAAPREASMSSRIWSSSRPSVSTSSSVRWVYSLTSEMAMGRSLDVEGAVTGGDRHACLDGLVRFEVLLTASQVADPSGVHGQRAGVADAHAAAVGHADAGLLAGLEERGRPVDLDRLARVAEGDRAALRPAALEAQREPLEVETVREAGL